MPPTNRLGGALQVASTALSVATPFLPGGGIHKLFTPKVTDLTDIKLPGEMWLGGTSS